MVAKAVKLDKPKENRLNPERIYMSLDDWISVRDNPRQRDTEKHAKRARHLRVPSPTHHLVSAARLPNGEMRKLDGHTRCLLWEKAEIPQPRQLIVDVYDVPDLKAAAELYIVFDNTGAVETSSDQISGAMHQRGIHFESTLLNSGRFGSAVKKLFPMMVGDSVTKHPELTYNAFDYFLPQLKLLDTCNPKRNEFPGSMIMAALATLKRRGLPGVEFWSRYAQGHGTKIDGEMDAVQALETAINRYKRTKLNYGAANTAGQDLFARAISAFEADRAGRSYTQGIKKLGAKALRAYLHQAAILGDRYE